MSSTKLMLPEVDVVLATDPGRDPEKQVNEDTCRHGETPFGHLLVVCDGMGGHQAGREASMLAVDTVFRCMATAPMRTDIPPVVRVREVLRDAVAVANHEVFLLGGAQAAARPGSTIVLALVHSLGTEVAHVGDSRAYFIHADEIRLVTKDHSMVQQLVDAKRLSPDEAKEHPEANKITRALGMSSGVEVEIERASITHVAGDIIVLCSDGLSDLVSAAEIRACVQRVGFRQAAAALVVLANERGGHDNVTVALMQARENALATSPAATQPMGFRLTEEMPAFAPVSSQRPGAPADSAPRVCEGEPDRHPDSRPLLPPAPKPARPAARHRGSPAVVAGLVLALVGLVALGVVVALQVAPLKDNNVVPALALSVVLPSATLDHRSSGEVEPDPGPSADGGRGRRFHNKTRKE